MNRFTTSLRNKYQAAFATISAADLAVIADSLGSLEGGGINGDLATYTILRQEGGVTKAFPLYMIRGDDGVWRIAEM